MADHHGSIDKAAALGCVAAGMVLGTLLLLMIGYAPAIKEGYGDIVGAFLGAAITVLFAAIYSDRKAEREKREAKAVIRADLWSFRQELAQAAELIRHSVHAAQPAAQGDIAGVIRDANDALWNSTIRARATLTELRPLFLSMGSLGERDHLKLTGAIEGVREVLAAFNAERGAVLLFTEGDNLLKAQLALIDKALG